MNSCRDSELCRGPRGFGQSGEGRTSFSFPGMFQRAPWLGLGQASFVPAGVSSGSLPWHWGPGPCVKAGLQGLRAGPSQSSQEVQALCRPQACLDEVLWGRCRKGPHLSGGLPGLRREQSCPWAAQVFCGQEVRLAEALQGR